MHSDLLADTQDRSGGWAVDVALWAFAVALLAIVGYANRHAINHDAVSYVFLAKHYLNGDHALAVSGLWSPLFVWLLAAVHWLIADPMTAARVAMGVSGLAFMAGACALADFLPNPMLRFGMKLVAALFAALASGVQVTPDLLSAGVYALACATLFAAGSDPWRVLAAGALFAVGYLAKTVLLPVAMAVILIHYGIMVATRALAVRQAILAVALSYAAIVLVAAPWISVLSAKYGYLTVSNVRAHQHAAAGPPGIAEDLASNRSFVIPERGRQSQFEDETIFPSVRWSPLDSPAHLIHYVRHIADRVPKVLNAARAADFLGLGLVFGLVLFVWHMARPSAATRLGLLLPAMTLPMLAYLPYVAIHIRLFFVCAPFFFACALGGAYAIGKGMNASRAAPCLTLLAFASLLASSALLLAHQSFRSWETEWYRRAKVLAPLVEQAGAAGPVATAGAERDKHLAIYLSYVLQQPYHGTSQDDGVAPILRSCARLMVARAGSAQDRTMRTAPERFEPLADRSPSIGRLLGDAGLRLYVIRPGAESYADRCRPPAPLWRIPLPGLR